MTLRRVTILLVIRFPAHAASVHRRRTGRRARPRHQAVNIGSRSSTAAAELLQVAIECCAAAHDVFFVLFSTGGAYMNDPVSATTMKTMALQPGAADLLGRWLGGHHGCKRQHVQRQHHTARVRTTWCFSTLQA